MSKKCAFQEKLKLYESLNNGVYEPTVFEPRYFASEEDKPEVGNPREKKRIRAFNYRQRKKRMEKVLDDRIELLQIVPMDDFEPLFDFTDTNADIIFDTTDPNSFMFNMFEEV